VIPEELNDIEIAPPAVVRQAAIDFAAALAETAEFSNFAAAAERFQNDLSARQAMEAFQDKQRALQMLLKHNAVSADDRAELEHLHAAFTSHASVQAYFEAQAAFQTLCQTAGSIISEATGLSFASACGGCCC